MRRWHEEETVMARRFRLFRVGRPTWEQFPGAPVDPSYRPGHLSHVTSPGFFRKRHPWQGCGCGVCLQNKLGLGYTTRRQERYQRRNRCRELLREVALQPLNSLVQ